MCVFCKIVNGEIPAYKVYEDNDVLAFLDISQITFGHTLVIPKKHYQNIFELDEETSQKLFRVVNMITKKMQKNLQINDLNIINNNGKLAGQEVNHYHIHLLPRYENDQVEFSFPKHEIDHEKLQDALKKILE
ncbi:MAG TPA: HIT family protein [Bacilli bacterium]